MRLRSVFSIAMAKAIAFACRLLHKQGVTLAGAMVMKVDPGLFDHLSAQLKRTIVVCGTNGKTTTNNLMAMALRANGHQVVINATGSNMKNGIVSALVLNSKWNGQIQADTATLEVDEASLRHVIDHLHVTDMVLTNLFRDQLDRFGEIDITMDLLLQAVQNHPDIHLIFNSDDVLSTQFALKSKLSYTTFGISKPMHDTNNADMKEGQFCPYCHAKLEYDFYHYAQLGQFHCPNGDFNHFPIDVDLRSLDSIDPLVFTINDVTFHSPLKGFYNVYNHMAVCALLTHYGESLSKFADELPSFQGAFGRLETFHIHGCDILLNLAKNPAGFNQNIDLIANDGSTKDVLIVINDNEQDGIDVSWLWDVDFDRLNQCNVSHYLTAGKRYMDMALRLKYVDIPSTPFDDIHQAISYALHDLGSTKLYILVNYTALYPTRQYLHELERKSA